MITYQEYKFDELPQDLQNDALENVADEMYQNFKDELFNDFDVLDMEIEERFLNYSVTFTEILEQAKKYRFDWTGQILKEDR